MRERPIRCQALGCTRETWRDDACCSDRCLDAARRMAVSSDRVRTRSAGDREQRVTQGPPPALSLASSLPDRSVAGSATPVAPLATSQVQP